VLNTKTNITRMIRSTWSASAQRGRAASVLPRTVPVTVVGGIGFIG